MSLVRASVLAVSLVLTVGACSSGSAPDVSHEGQIDYACALADHVADDLDLDGWSPLERANHGALREIGALVALVGGTARLVHEHEQLADAGQALFAGLQRMDDDLMQQGLDGVAQQCTDVDTSSEPDVTDEGQLDYACALMDHVLEEHGEVGAWDREDYAWDEVVGVASLAGVVSGVEASGPADLVEPASNVFAGVVRLDEEAMRAGVDGIDRWCQER